MLVVAMSHVPFVPLQLSKIQRYEARIGLPPLTGYSGYGNERVRELGKKTHNVLIENVLVPPSQREKTQRRRQPHEAQASDDPRHRCDEHTAGIQGCSPIGGSEVSTREA